MKPTAKEPKPTGYEKLSDDQLSKVIEKCDLLRSTMGGASFGPYLEAARRWKDRIKK